MDDGTRACICGRRGGLGRLLFHEASLVQRDGVRYFRSHIARVRNVFRRDVFADSFLELKMERSERENIPKLRCGGDAREVLEVHRGNFLVEERGLIDDHHFFRRHEDEVELPVEEGFEDGGECEEHPCGDDCGDDPPRGNFQREIDGAESDAGGDQCDREKNLIDDGEEEEETVAEDGHDLLFIGREETALDSIDVGIESEEMHKRTIDVSADKCSFCYALRVHDPEDL